MHRKCCKIVKRPRDAGFATGRVYAERFSWRASAETFLFHLVPLGGH
jgi:hypothetical protein